MSTESDTRAPGTPQAECSTATAEAVIRAPDAMNLVECGLPGQAYIAYDAIADHLDGEHYLKKQLHGGRTVASTGNRADSPPGARPGPRTRSPDQRPLPV